MLTRLIVEIISQQYKYCYTNIYQYIWYLYIYVYVIAREGNGTPLQYSCLENPMDGGAW